MNFKRILLLAFVFLVTISALFFALNYLRPKPKYNLILISVDTLRPDHMGVYGYSKNTTPNIDKWARTATVFTNMRTQIPITYPSFSILLSGRSVFDSGIINNEVDAKTYAPSSGWIPIDSNITTLAQTLKKNGYVTGAFMNTASLYGSPTGLDRAFDIYQNSFSNSSLVPNRNLLYKSYIPTTQGLAWLEKNKDKRFFLWIHLMEPHWPYSPPKDLRCKFNNQLCDKLQNKTLEELESIREYYRGCQKSIPEEIINLMETLYDGEIASADQLVGKILDQVEQKNLDRNTVVILYGDHGEGFDHNFYFDHSQDLYDSFVKIPFIAKIPEMKNKIIKDSLQNTQIEPSILRILGILGGNKYESDSFYPLLNATGKGYTPPKYYYYINNEATKFAIQDKNYKFIYNVPNSTACNINNQPEELYNLEDDPAELNNIISDKPDVARRLKIPLFNYIDKTGILTPKNTLKVRDQNDQNAIEELKSLGY